MTSTVPNEESGVPDINSDDLPALAAAYPELAEYLASQPTPDMPASVWTDIQARLAQEAPLVTNPAHASAEGVTDLAAHRNRRRRAPILTAAASLVLIGAVGVPVVMNSTSSAPPVADGPVVAASATPAPRVATSTEPTLAATPGPAPADSPSAVPAEPTSPGMASVPARTVVASGINYDAEGMSAQVGELLSSAGLISTTMPDLAAPDMQQPETMAMVDQVVNVAKTTPTGYPPMIGSAGFTADVDDMRSCLEKIRAKWAAKVLAGDPSTPALRDPSAELMPALVVDRAVYQGNDSGVVVMLNEDDGGAARLDVVVIRPECTTEDVDQAAWFHYDLP
ncbi:MAG: hypothetical protein WAO41_02115 [Candidatus Nanopelagicales bacterium]